MKNKNIFFAAAIAGFLGTAGYGLYWAGMYQGRKMTAPMSDEIASAPVNAPTTGDAGKKVLYWHDPMVPAQKFDKPGKSPFMDMQLVPVYTDDAGDDGKVNISPRVQQNLGIRTTEVTRGDLSSAVVAVGSVGYNERDVALVQARSNGFVERLYVRGRIQLVLATPDY